MNNSIEEGCGSCGYIVWGLEREELGFEGVGV